MEKRRKNICLCGAFVLCLSMIIALIWPSLSKCEAAGENASSKSSDVLNDSSYNENLQDFEAWTKPVTSYITATDTGYMYLRRIDNETLVYFLDKNFHNTKRIVVSEELPVWGGFCTDGKYYYICTGQKNLKQDDDLEVIRVTKYNKNFKKISSCSIKNVNVYEPYAFSGMTAAFKDNHMIMQTGRTMYMSDDGNHHQRMLTVEINTDTMKPENTGIDYGWVSHSLYQNVKIDGNMVVSAEMGDAYPRGWLLLITPNTFTGSRSGYTRTIKLMDVPQYNEFYQSIRASMGGLEISKNNYLVAGNSLLHDDKRNERTTRNIWVAVCNKETEKVALKQITSYKEGDASASVPQLVKISDSKFLLMWGHNDKVCYAVLDGNGNVKGNIYEKAGFLSDCQPIVSNGKVIWVTAKGTELKLYSIKISKPDKFVVNETLNGHKFVTDSVNKSGVVLKCESCNITKDIYISDFTIWRSTAQYGEIYHGTSEQEKLELGQEAYIWITFSDKSSNTDIECKNSDDSVVKVEKLTIDGMMIRLTGLSNGVSNLTVYSKWDPSRKTVIKFISGTGKKDESKEYKISASKKSIEYSELKKNPVNIKLYVSGGKGKVTYKNTSGDELKKYITISADGTVTFAQNAKKGTYKIKVTAKASGNYKKTVKTVKITVK